MRELNVVEADNVNGGAVVIAGLLMAAVTLGIYIGEQFGESDGECSCC